MKQNRSALIREALREHLDRLRTREREERDRRGYEKVGETAQDLAVWEKVALGVDDGMQQACCVNLHNVVTVSQDAVGRRVARLSPERMDQVCAALEFALGCDR